MNVFPKKSDSLAEGVTGQNTVSINTGHTTPVTEQRQKVLHFS